MDQAQPPECVPGIAARICTRHSRLNVYHLGLWHNASRQRTGGETHEKETYESHPRYHPAITTGRGRTTHSPGYENFAWTVHKYHKIAKQKNYLERPDAVPGENELREALGVGVQTPRQVSTVEPYRAAIQDWLKQGVEMTAIWLRLQENYGYKGGYSSIRRFVHRLEPVEAEAFVRVHSEPGEDMQVDFGSVGQLYDPVMKRLRTAYVFVATLGYSRHQYAELVFDQKTATWIALHKRAFEYFGGVPQRVIPDNLKAAVLQALVHDAVLGEAYSRLALHYGFLISPTIPHTPQHKGKVESGVHYIQRNFMAGQEFVDIHVGNQHLQDWILNTAGVRKHGTTGEAPLHLFHETEKACLQPLPARPFQLLEIRPVKVHPDCHVIINGSFYSVPFGYIGQELAAHVSENFVEIYQGQNLVTTHPRSTRPGAMAYAAGRLSACQSRLPDTHAGLLQETGSKDWPIYLECGGTTASRSTAGPVAFGTSYPAA